MTPRASLRSPWLMAGLALALVALLGVACNTTVPDSSVAATAHALTTFIPATATQRATAIPNPYAQLQTAQAQATQVAAHAQATLSAQQTLQALQGNATAQAFAPVLAELPYFGVDPDIEGHPGWLHPPLTLTAKGYHTATYGNKYPQTVMRDGVLSAKITWDTKYGSGGCGFVVRANGDEQAPSEYVILMMRSSQLLFTVLKDGELANLRVIFIRAHDRKFDWHNGATNQLTVVLRNDRIALYTNHALHKILDPNERPSLYLPLLIPPDKTVQALKLPPPPEVPANPSQSQRSALRAYVAQVDERLAAYLDMLDGLIQQEEDPVRKAQLSEYRAQVLQSKHLFKQSAQALQFFLAHPDEDLNLGPGFLSFVAAAESAYATCEFHEGWLWILDPSAP